MCTKLLPAAPVTMQAERIDTQVAKSASPAGAVLELPSHIAQDIVRELLPLSTAILLRSVSRSWHAAVPASDNPHWLGIALQSIESNGQWKTRLRHPPAKQASDREVVEAYAAIMFTPINNRVTSGNSSHSSPVVQEIIQGPTRRLDQLLHEWQRLDMELDYYNHGGSAEILAVQRSQKAHRSRICEVLDPGSDPGSDPDSDPDSDLLEEWRQIQETSAAECWRKVSALTLARLIALEWPLSVMHIAACHTEGAHYLQAAAGGSNIVRGTAAVLIITLNSNCWVADWRCGAWQEGSSSNWYDVAAITAGLMERDFGSHAKCVQSASALVQACRSSHACDPIAKPTVQGLHPAGCISCKL